jgi:5-formyltetrahydrofolate cyclo-ligase
MEISKKILRQQGRQIRNGICDAKRTADASALKDNVVTALSRYNYKIVGTYYPHGGEIAPPHELPNAHMALPVIRDEVTLQFYPWSPTMRLIKRNFDIPIPDTRGHKEVFPDVILLPLVLCDTQGNRIGQGAGHYDRYVASRTDKPILIGVCFEEQVYGGTIPAEPHDRKLDLIITSKRIIDIL